MRTLVLILTLLSWTTPSVAQEATAEPTPTVARTPEEVSAMSLNLFVKLMSPYCPGASLRDCGSGQAEVLRDRIRAWVTEGQSEAWITQQLLDEFGEEILGAPLFQGFGMVAYIAPIVAFLLGAGAIFLFLRRQKRVKSQLPEGEIVTPGDFALGDEAAQRLDRELELRAR